MCVCVWELKARRSLKPLRSTAPSSSIVLKRELLWYHITQLSVLTLDFDRWRFSAVVEHTPPSPQPFKRSWKAPLYIKTASTLPATSSDMTHARQRWPQQWLSSFDGKTLECLFTSGGLLACPSAFWSCHGRSGDAASRPGSAKGERERGGHIGSTCSETHGQNQTQSVWSEGGGVFFNGREGWACSCSVVFRFGREGWRRDIRIESVSNYNHPSPVIKMWANPRCCRQCEQQKAVAAKCRKLEKIRLRSNWEPFSMETFWVVTFFFFHNSDISGKSEFLSLKSAFWEKMPELNFCCIIFSFTGALILTWAQKHTRSSCTLTRHTLFCIITRPQICIQPPPPHRSAHPRFIPQR